MRAVGKLSSHFVLADTTRLYDGKAFDMRIAVGSCFHEKA